MSLRAIYLERATPDRGRPSPATGAVPVLRVCTLGGLHLPGPEGPATGPAGQRKALALLALLSAGRTSRDKLVGYLWPESPDDRARHALSQLVYTLRKDHGEHVVLGTTELWLDPASVVLDIWEFEQALKQGDDARALELYQGPFLEGFFLGDSAEFERWLDGQRERLRQLAVGAARRLMDAAERAETPTVGARWARRLAELSPDDEDGLARLIGFLDQSGDPAGALRAYDHFARMLLEDYELEPSAETRALVAAIRARRVTAGVAVPPLPPRRARPLWDGEVTDEIAPALGDGTPGATSPGRPRRAMRRSHVTAALLGAGILAATVGALGLTDTPASLDPDRIVVAPFVNETGDSTVDALGRLAADWITQGLSETGFAEVVSARTVRLLGRTGDAGAGVLARATGAATVIEGAYYRAGTADITFHTRVVDARTGRVLQAVPPVRAPSAAPLVGIGELRQRTMAALAAMRDPRASGMAVHASQPPTFEAYKEYATGEELFIRRDWRGAIEHFDRAFALDSSFTLPLLWVSVACIQIGQPAKADSIATFLNGVRERLAPMDLAMLDWLAAYLRGDAVERYRATARQRDLSPGSEAEYQFALEALRLGRAEEALAASAHIDPTIGALSGRFEYWKTVTAAHHLLGNHRQELRAAHRGRDQYPDNMHTLLYEVRALAALGRERAVSERLDAALALPPHRTGTAGLVMQTAAAELRAHGHPAAARAANARALRWYRERPATEREGVPAQVAIGRSLYLAGRWEEAERSFERLAVSDTARVEYLGYLGVLAARQNAGPEAMAISDRLGRLDRRYLWGEHTVWRARIAALLSDRVAAVALLRRAAGEGYRFAWNHHADPDLESLRDYPPFQTLTRPSE